MHCLICDYFVFIASRAIIIMKRSHPGENHGQEQARYSRLNQETLQYYREINAHFKSVTDEDEKQLMADNVFEETAGREVEIVPDAECSRVLEQLIPYASTEAFVRFIENCTKDDNLGMICTR